MTFQYSIAVNNARLDAVEAAVGASAKFKIYTGSEPANCAAAATGTLLVDMSLPADWMNTATGASKSKQGTWTGTGLAGGVAGYFRITDASGASVGIQGTVGTSGTDAIIDNATIAVAQAVTVSVFTLNAGNL